MIVIEEEMGALRFFLAVCVVLSHNAYNPLFIGGTFAVMIFFIISGFFIALVLNQKYTEPNPARFYAARYLRLMPAYLVVLIPTTLLLNRLPLGDGISAIYTTLTEATLLGIQTLWWFIIEPGGTLALASSISDVHRLSNWTALPQMWSVGVEIVFYLLSPLFVRRVRLSIILFLAAFALHLCLTLNLSALHPIQMRSALSYFWLYMAGVLGYHAWVRCRAALDKFPVPPITVSIFAVALAASLTYLRHFPVVPWMTGHLSPFRNDLSLLFAAIAIPIIFHYTRNAKWDRLIGELSYPIYVVHWPVAAYIITTHRGDLSWSLLIVAISVGAATLLHVAIERPVERWRGKVTAQSRYLRSGRVLEASSNIRQ